MCSAACAGAVAPPRCALVVDGGSSPPRRRHVLTWCHLGLHAAHASSATAACTTAPPLHAQSGARHKTGAVRRTAPRRRDGQAPATHMASLERAAAVATGGTRRLDDGNTGAATAPPDPALIHHRLRHNPLRDHQGLLTGAVRNNHRWYCARSTASPSIARQGARRSLCGGHRPPRCALAPAIEFDLPRRLRPLVNQPAAKAARQVQQDPTSRPSIVPSSRSPRSTDRPRPSSSIYRGWYYLTFD